MRLVHTFPARAMEAEAADGPEDLYAILGGGARIPSRPAAPPPSLTAAHTDNATRRQAQRETGRDQEGVP